MQSEYTRAAGAYIDSGRIDSPSMITTGDPNAVLACCEAQSEALDRMMKSIDILESKAGPVLSPAAMNDGLVPAKNPTPMKQSEVIERMQDSLRRTRLMCQHIDRISERMQI